MPNILLIGFTTEGPSDKRFFESIIERTFNNLLNESPSEIDIFSPIYLIPQKKVGFTEKIMASAREAAENGVMVLCVHTDADAESDETVFKNKMDPAFLEVLAEVEGAFCKNLCAIVPVFMTEAWLLADKKLFKEEILSEKSDQELGIQHHPESYNDPKRVINEAIRVAQEDIPKKSRGFDISDIYQPLGQQIPLEKLAYLDSYKKFAASAKNALIKLNYLH